MRRPSTVITGIGLATSLGTSAEETWAGVLQSLDSLSNMPALESPPPLQADGHSKGGYQAADLPSEFEVNLPREVRYLRWTIGQAVRQARASQIASHRCGIVLGTTLHGMRSGGEFLRTNRFELLTNFLAGSTLANAVEPLGWTGESLTTCSACSSSLGSVALAMTLLETNQLDLVLCGGYDATSEYAYAGFNSLRLVADGKLRPFGTNRQGMKLGEGYAILALERAADAKTRGVTSIARILGFGESADAHHLTQPDPRGAGAAAAVRAALARSSCEIEKIGLIAAHATGTPDNDAGEHHAYAGVFGERLPSIAVVGFKSHLGHTLGGAGAVELILSALALRDQIIPPTANSSADTIEFRDLSLNTGKPRSARIDATLNTSLGFGGANTCVVLSRDAASVEPAEILELREVVISGIGVVLPGAVGNEALIRKLMTEAPAITADTGPIAESEYLHLLNARRVRRMSDYVKLTLAAATLAVADAGVAGGAAFTAGCAAVLGSTHAGAGYCVDYYRQIVQGGMSAANPMLFAEGVPNAAAAHLSMTFGIKGSCQTILGTRTAGLDALRMAYLRIASGEWDRAIVGAAEEFTPLATAAYGHCIQPPAERASFFIGSGAATFILESREAMTARGGRAHATITAATGGRFRANHAVADVAAMLSRIGSTAPCIGSANRTWVDRVESAAMRHAGVGVVRPSDYGLFPELFSVAPLASFAGEMLRPSNDRCGVTILCTGFTGSAAAVTIKRQG